MELPNSYDPGMSSFAPQLPNLDSPLPNLNHGLSGGSFLSPSISGFGFGSSNSGDFIDKFYSPITPVAVGITTTNSTTENATKEATEEAEMKGASV